MKTFKSHKLVTATPMNRLDYNIYRGWELPSNENGSDEGYLVEYLDGGESNHPEHKGYISWSPKAQFDNGYSEEPTDFKGRLVKEHAELSDKAAKLKGFIGTDAFKAIDDNQRELLEEQLNAMIEYGHILEVRLELLG